jgi:hypothetical protein
MHPRPRIGCIATRTPHLPCLISFHLDLQLYHLSWCPVYELIHEEQRRKKPKMSTERQYQNETKRDEKTKTNCRSVTHPIGFSVHLQAFSISPVQSIFLCHSSAADPSQKMKNQALRYLLFIFRHSNFHYIAGCLWLSQAVQPCVSNSSHPFIHFVHIPILFHPVLELS